MLAVLAISAIVLWFLWTFRCPPRPRNFPPGPNGYPIVGAAFMVMKVGQTIASTLVHLSKTYGPVMGIQLGNFWAVAVTGPAEIREVLSKESFAGRPEFVKSFNENKLGLMFVDGPSWKIQRRFTLRHLRDWGFGKSSLENVIHEEVEQCLKEIDTKLNETSNSVIPIHDLFGISVINILWTVMAGKRHSHDDADFVKLIQNVRMIFRTGTTLGSLGTRFPLIKYLPYIGEPRRRMEAAQKELTRFLQDTIRYHQETRDPSSPRDFMDEYLKTLEESPNNGESTDPSFSVDQLISICSDLFSAGAESTSNSIAFALLYVILHPHVQDKVREEIKSVVGNGGLVSYTDRFKLPYTEAVLAELQRITSIAPLTPPHCALEDTKLAGYDIPKGTFTFVNLWALHNDKKVWGDPEQFRPQRFLDAQGRFVKNENVIPFGTGKRACPGESLARTNIFIFFVTLIHNYRFEVDSSTAMPSTVPISGFTAAPQPFSAKVIKLT